MSYHSFIKMHLGIILADRFTSSPEAYMFLKDKAGTIHPLGLPILTPISPRRDPGWISSSTHDDDVMILCYT